MWGLTDFGAGAQVVVVTGAAQGQASTTGRLGRRERK
jgi:hypothetical protein